MPRFQKQILEVGKYHSPDGVVDVTPSRLRHWARNFGRFTKNGNKVPVNFSHDHLDVDEAKSLATSDGRRDNRDDVGFLKSFKVLKGGRSAQIELDLRDKDAIKAAKRNTSQVSPVIFDHYTDGRGDQFKDVITHVDLVNHPVDTSQTDFSPVATP